jgi:hypothetical protein
LAQQDRSRAVKYIDDRSLRRKVHAILTKAGKRLEQDDNFPHMVTGSQGRIADKPPVIYHLTQKGDVNKEAEKSVLDDPSSVVIRADGLSKHDMLCRHRATYFSIGRKTRHRDGISMCVN